MFFLWIFPEVAGLLFVILWPLFYRSVASDVLHSAARKIGLDEKKAVAICNYHQDLGLAIVSVLNCGFSIFKYMVLIKVRSGWYPDWVMPVAFLYPLFGALWLLFLHKKSDSKRYETVDTDGVFWFWGFTRPGSVAGPIGRWILWTRWLVAGFAVVLSVVTAATMLHDDSANAHVPRTTYARSHADTISSVP